MFHNTGSVCNGHPGHASEFMCIFNGRQFWTALGILGVKHFQSALIRNGHPNHLNTLTCIFNVKQHQAALGMQRLITCSQLQCTMDTPAF